MKEGNNSGLILTGTISETHLSLFETEVERIISNKIKGLNITLNSPGGDVNTAIKIINQITKLKDKGIDVNTHGIKLVGSAALAIYAHGMLRTLETSASIVIDLPFKIYDKKLALGFPQTEKELLRLIEENKLIQLGRVQWAEVFSEITNQPIETIYKLEGKYLTANEAQELGFCHTILN